MTIAHAKPLLVRALTGEARRPPPVWLLRQAGRYLPEYRRLRTEQPDFVAFCLEPDLAVEATLQPLRRYDFDAAIVFADILLLPHGAGRTVRFLEGEGPCFEPLDSIEALDALDWSKALEVCAPVSESVRRLRKTLEPSVGLIGFAGAPWTVATYLLGGRGGDSGRRRAVVEAARSPELTRRLLSELADATADYLVDQARAGADALMVFESWAGAAPAGYFGPWVVDPTRQLVERIRSVGVTTPIIGFPRGSGALAVDYARLTGVDAVSLDQTQATVTMRDALSDVRALQGGLDPAILIAGGAALDAEIDRLLALFQDRAFVFNLGHGITPDTPPAHVERLVNRVKGSVR